MNILVQINITIDIHYQGHQSIAKTCTGLTSGTQLILTGVNYSALLNSLFMLGLFGLILL